MATYEIEMSDGRKVQFDWEGQGTPSNEIYQQVIDSIKQPGTISQAPPKWVEPIRTGASLTGMLGGGAIGAASGLLTGPGAPVASPLGAVAGAGLGGAGVKNFVDWLLAQAGVVKPKTPIETLKQIGIDIPTMGAMEAGGQVIPPITSLIGKAMSHPWGAYSGMGAKGIQEAYASGMKPTESGFMKFARKQGNIPEITETAGSGLDKLIESRATDYESALANLKGVAGLSENEVSNILNKSIQKYGFKYTPQGKLDWTNTEWSTNPVAQKEIQTAIDTVKGWTDYSALGVDKLKRALGNLLKFSQPEASGFVANLKGNIRDLLLNKVPEYGNLVKPYEESTQLINEIRKDFSIGTRQSQELGLRKLIRGMREDNQLREDLLSVISTNANKPLEPMLAGMLAQSWIPTSLAGRMGGMYEIIRGTAAFDPHMAIALASSSPRISAEFLHVLGKIGPKVQTGLRYLPPSLQAVMQPKAQPPLEEILKKKED